MHQPATTVLALAASAKSRDLPGEALVHAFNHVRTELLSTLYFQLGHLEDAQDATRNAFLSCWRARDRFACVRYPRAWIFRVGLNCARDLMGNAWQRIAGSLTVAGAPVAGRDVCPVEALAAGRTQQRLHQAVLVLPPALREIFLLRQTGGLTYEEISWLRRCSLGAVKTQMRAAIHKLRLVLQETEFEDDAWHGTLDDNPVVVIVPSHVVTAPVDASIWAVGWLDEGQLGRAGRLVAEYANVNGHLVWSCTLAFCVANPVAFVEMTISVAGLEMTVSEVRNLAMKTRMFGSVGVVALALAVVGLGAFAQQGQTQEKKVDHEEHGAMMQECAKACSDCQRACDACATHCTHMLAEGKKDHLTTLMTCQDCATMWSAAAQIVARGGPHSVLICECCAKACDQCGRACEKFPDDKHMKACAEECRKCAKACRAMVEHMASK
jgi:RNA polymerase sigma factor (sigma-70 family)